MLEWTGERFIPWMEGGQIHYEHIHRYAFASQFVKGKKVLDLACGEGYGSHIFSKNAEYVVGIEIDENAVEHARNKYTTQNLEFIQGSILEIPIQGNEKFDVIVCFEGIEHVEEHEKLLSEVKRLLDKGGVFIVSSPNKKTYSDDLDFNNPFHKKELYFNEFRELLDKYFINSIFFGQKVYGSSNIWSLPPYQCSGYKEFIIEKQDKEFYFSDIEKKTPLYFIAIASNKKLDNQSYNIGSHLIDISNILIGDFEKQVGMLTNTVGDRDKNITELTNALQTRDTQITEINDALKARDTQFTEINDALKARDVQITEINDALKARDIQITEINDALKTRDTQITEINSTLQARDVQITEINDALKTRDTQITEINSTLQARDVQIFSLENEIHLMQQSIVWRLTMKFHNIFVERILPHGTKQRNMYDLALKGCRIIINEGIKSFWWHYKERGRVKKLEGELRSDVKEIQDIAIDKNIKNWCGENIIFPAPSENPEVSIIIPVHNNVNYTFNCLDSILKHTHESFEIIVVDDASDDETPDMLKSMENIAVIRNDTNQGFVESCNRGAKLSRSDYLFFLNNDTVVTENWLKPLKKAISKDNVGAVGAKLVYPDGKLQEAGGIIWNDASGWNYGRYDDPNKPEYNFIREVDYCSGAALIVKKHIFEELGGFDERFKPGYYEDTDLCFSIREKGYKVLYQPKSIIIHFEGVTSGTDVNKGVKSYQEINKSKFYAKWKDVLGNKHYNPDSANLLFHARDKRNGNNILVIDHYIPTFDMDSGSYRMYNILRILSELGHKVTFIGDNPEQFEPYTGVFQQNSVEVIYAPFIISIEDYLSRNGIFFDMIFLSRSHIAMNHISAVKKYCTKAKVIFDTVDLQYLRETRRAAVEGDENILKSANMLKEMEFQLARQCDMTLVVSHVEKEIIFEEAPDLKVEILSNIHEMFPPIKYFSERKDIMFLGGFNHLPNIDAVKYFSKDILPMVMKEIPDIKFYVVGSNPPKEIRQLESDNIIVTGYVEDLTPYFENYRISVAPLRYGAGVKGKIGEAMAHGLPVVTTLIGAEGMGLVDGENVLIADTSDEFAKKIVMLYDDEEMWNGFSDNSLIAIESNYSYDATKTILIGLINKINGNNSNVMRHDWNKRGDLV